jgi:AAHS family 4-hydroxybenzoate transporter-like MFS transporter
MGKLHWLVVIVSFTLMLIDGYDLICIAFVAPLLQKEWGFDRASFGLLFSAATLGTAIGPPIFGALADRIGRKPVLLMGSVGFGAFTLAGVLAGSLQDMLIMRFAAGIGLGGTIATAIAYVSEFAPRRIRSAMIVMGVVGVALGGGVGSVIAANLLGTYTWRIMFWIGGLAPLIAAAVGVFIVPESPKYLALLPERRGDLVALLWRLAPERTFAMDETFILNEPANRFSFAAAFAGKLASVVPLLMLTNFLAQFALFFVNQWITVLMTAGGASVQRAAVATGAFQVLGFIGALGITRPVDRFGFLPVPVLFAAAAVVVATIGVPGLGETALICLNGAAGFCIIGLQFGNIATTGQVFPTPVRSGGVGLIYGVGRIGSFAGPAIAGLLVAMHVPLGNLFYYAGALMLLGVVAGAALTPLYRQQLDALHR